MGERPFLAFLIGILSFGLIVAKTFGAEKIRLGTGAKMFPGYYLTVLAAEEKGIWKQNGLVVESILFRDSPLMMAGVASGDNRRVEPSWMMPGRVYKLFICHKWRGW